jgi:hypothetical protein
VPSLTATGSPTANGSSYSLDTTDRLTAAGVVLSDVQGWMAGRVKPTWAAASPPSSGPRMFEIDAGSHLLYDQATSKWKAEMQGISSVCLSAAQSFVANTTLTLISFWTNTTVAISVDGSAFTTVTRVYAAPSLFNLEVGNRPAADRSIGAEIFWMCGGSGTLSDADATTIHGFGDTDPLWGSIPGSPVFLWAAVDLTYLIASPVTPPFVNVNIAI